MGFEILYMSNHIFADLLIFFATVPRILRSEIDLNRILA